MRFLISIFPACFLLLLQTCEGRKHHLVLTRDGRKTIPLSTFGFYKGGELKVNLTGFQTEHESEIIGFSIDKTISDALNPYVETADHNCILNKHLDERDKAGILRFTLNFKDGVTKVQCSNNMQEGVIISQLKEEKDSALSDSKMFAGREKRMTEDGDLDNFFLNSPLDKIEKVERSKEGEHTFIPSEPAKETMISKQEDIKNQDISKNVNLGDSCSSVNIPIVKYTEGGMTKYKTSFVVKLSTEDKVSSHQEGLYSMYFHNCYNFQRGFRSRAKINMTIDIIETNGESYLSAGEMPLPALYQMLSITFFLAGCFWIFILRKNGAEQVFRIHWIMASLIFLKSLSLFFHGVNYHMIATNGYHIETWAVLYYITHLLKGGLLFFTIVLIGSGWAFIKHILNSKEKRVFMVVLPLQVLANVAYIIVEESEQGEKGHNFWKEVFILIDLVCCGAILLPVVWSIRHLQEASATDGKAAVSLEKLGLFRHFYIMVVCYVYFTRIIVYLLKITVPFQYEWLDELFKEIATFIFFAMTGYKFRPASNNPYFSVPSDDYDMEEQILVGSTSIQDQVQKRGGRVILDDEYMDDGNDDETVVLFNKSESSHDLD